MIPILRGMTKGQTYRGGRRNNFVMPVAMLVMLLLVGQAFWLSRNSHMFAPFAVSRIDCETCAKLGTIRDPDNARIRQMCPACFGVGFKNIRRFDDQDVICLACGGMGRLEENGQWRNCLRCGGRGLHRAGDWKEIVELLEAPEYIPETTNGAPETFNIEPSTLNHQPSTSVSNPEP